MLALMGANSSVLKYEDIRVLKETKNNINRKVNCFCTIERFDTIKNKNQSMILT